MKTLYIGADIAKRSFVAAYWHGQHSQVWGQVANQTAGYARIRRDRTYDGAARRRRGYPGAA